MKFIKYIFVIIVCVFLTFCTSNTILKKPDNLISKDKMADVLTDMLLATGGKNIKNLNLERKINYFPLVYEKHQIDSLQFEESSAFYISRIDDYNDLLKEVNKRLSTKKDELKAIKKIKDSISKVRKDSIKKNRNRPNEFKDDSIPRRKFELKKPLLEKSMEQ